MPKYVKPNGTKIEVNDSAKEYVESLGWVLDNPKPKAKPKAK